MVKTPKTRLRTDCVLTGGWIISSFDSMLERFIQVGLEWQTAFANGLHLIFG
jgi:hypothetical protein